MSLCNDWLAEAPFEGLVDIDPKTGEIVHTLALTKDFPIDAFQRKANEAIVNGKHSFDQAAYAAVSILDGTSPKKGWNFPWSESETGLQAILKKRKCPSKLEQAFMGFGFYLVGMQAGSPKKLARIVAQMANQKHSIGFSVCSKMGTIVFENISVVGQAGFLPTSDGYLTNGGIEIVRSAPGSEVSFDLKSGYLAPAFEKGSLLENVYAIEAIQVFLESALLVTDTLEAVVAK